MTDGREAVRSPGRLAGLDGLRGIAALLVVFTHAWYLAARPDLHLGPVSILLTTGYAAVDVFFVMSGYVLFAPMVRTGGDPGRWSRFAVRRILRFWPTYAAALALCLVTLRWTSGYHAFWHWDGTGIRDLVRHVFFLETLLVGFLDRRSGFGADQVIWTLNIELGFALLLPLIARWWFRHPLLGLTTAVLMARAWTHFATHLGPLSGHRQGSADLQNLQNHTLIQLPAYAGHFALGMTLAWLLVVHERAPVVARLRKHAGQLALTGLTLYAGALVILADREPKGYNGYLHWTQTWMILPGVALLMPGLVLLSGRPLRIVGSRVPAFLARISYPLYLVHVPVMRAVINLWRPPDSDQLRLFLVLISSLVVSVPIAVVLHRVVEVPGDRLGRRLSRPAHRLSRPSTARQGMPVGEP